MKFCNKCGAKIIDNANFCNKCGAPLKEQNNLEKNSSEELNNRIILNDENFNNIKDNINSTENTNINSKKLETNSNNPNSNSICNNDIKDSLNNNKTNINNSNSKKRNKILVSIAILVVLIGGALFFSKDFILYHYYYNSATNETTIQNKLTSYNKALALNYNTEILNNIYNIINKDPDFQKDLSLVTNLKKSDKQNIIYKICTLNSTEYYNNGNYEKAVKYYNIAKSNGCNVKNFPNSDVLIKNFKNDSTNNFNYNKDSSTSAENLKEKLQSKDEYIEPNSNSTYLKENDLKKYDKQTLSLIRNEIYARDGYVFHTEPFKSYFDSKSWYVPNPSFQGNINDLNDYEQKNVQLIQKLENE